MANVVAVVIDGQIQMQPVCWPVGTDTISGTDLREVRTALRTFYSCVRNVTTSNIVTNCGSTATTPIKA